jgi:hypothetical protein
MAPFSNIVHAYLQSKDEGKTTEENRAGEGNGSRVVIGASLLRVSLRVGRSLGARLGNGLVAVLGVGAGLLRGGGAGGGGLFVGAGGGGGSSIRGSSAVGLVGVLVVATSGLRSADARGEEVLVDAAVAALNVSSSLLLGAVALLALGDAVNGVQSLVLVGVGNLRSLLIQLSGWASTSVMTHRLNIQGCSEPGSRRRRGRRSPGKR